jgi:hypothetical protein
MTTETETKRPKGWLDPIREAEAVAALRESLASIEMDEGEVSDLIEGETSLYEAIDKLLARIVDAHLMLDGIKTAVERLNARKERYERQVDQNRALIEQAMLIADVAKIERPTHGLTLAKRPSKVEITDEAAIPARFWKPADPTLDKRALADALKAGEAVEGAAMTQPAPTLTIRSA